MADQGFRGAVTGGGHMDGFVLEIAQTISDAGIDQAHIFRGGATSLPGYFRPTKEWDVVVVSDETLLAAIELKSQVGPSFGNNFNNRAEEAVGNAVDLAAAYRQGAFGRAPPPWLGYLFLLEDCDATRREVNVREPHFPVLPEFEHASYAERYELLLRKLVSELHYQSTCLLLSAEDAANRQRNYSEPAGDLAGGQWLASLTAHITGALAA
jgi:hypothetical protein